mmetsp:Transcript_23363/g.34855  ORF Transcript_23363/g.34855 Transcript_23363/m.34855 type:complete len:385 (-) Transcript_23363:63-1217(-)
MKSVSTTSLAIIGVLVALIMRNWDTKESFAINFSALQFTYLVPSINVVLNRPQRDQIAYLQFLSSTSTFISSKILLPFFWDDALYQPSHGPNATRVVELTIPSTFDPDWSIPVTCTCPKSASLDSNLPIVLYFHAGGMIFGSVAQELFLARYTAHKASAVVCSIEYRLAPLHPYPAALNDAIDASLALLDNDEEKNPIIKAFIGGVGINTSNFATIGISAGGFMSAHTSRLLAHHGKTATIQVSLVPMAKPNGGTNSMIKYWNNPFWSGTQNSFAWSVYLPGDDGTLTNDWRVSLLVDPPEQETLDKLPPVYIQINTKDVLRDEGEMYAQRLKAAGKLIGFAEYDTYHVGGVPGLDRGGPGEGSYDRALSVLMDCLNNPSNCKM